MRKKDQEGMQGATFGVMEAVIMMLGVMTGLSVTGNKFIMAIGLLTAGLADAVANSVAFHVSEETETIHTQREVWKSTFYTFFGTAATVVIVIWPIILFEIRTAIAISWIIGIIILSGVGYSVSRLTKREKAHRLIIEYVAFGVIASALCYGLGALVVHFTSSLA